MTAYYNENDPVAAEWLRRLIASGLIAPGDVDDRGIEDVTPNDLRGYTQCHFFAGIGGWSYALQLTGWPDGWPVWTGSCPCQPFSAAGARKGTDDARHLWPHWRWLIDQCRPPVVFGEQVASKDGRGWLAGVRTDLEALGYGVGAADLCAAGVEAPHIRQRLYWMADADRERRTRIDSLLRAEVEERRGAEAVLEAAGSSAGGRLGDASEPRLQERKRDRGVQREAGRASAGQAAELPGNPWRNAIWLPCADGKARRIEPGLEPLAHGVPGRVGRLRAYGNAIIPQVAEVFVRACDVR